VSTLCFSQYLLQRFNNLLHFFYRVLFPQGNTNCTPDIFVRHMRRPQHMGNFSFLTVTCKAGGTTNPFLDLLNLCADKENFHEDFRSTKSYSFFFPNIAFSQRCSRCNGNTSSETQTSLQTNPTPCAASFLFLRS